MNQQNKTNEVKKQDKNNKTYSDIACEQKNCLNAYANVDIIKILSFFLKRNVKTDLKSAENIF